VRSRQKGADRGEDGGRRFVGGVQSDDTPADGDTAVGAGDGKEAIGVRQVVVALGTADPGGESVDDLGTESVQGKPDGGAAGGAGRRRG
jgi:hypothetical protein